MKKKNRYIKGPNSIANAYEWIMHLTDNLWYNENVKWKIIQPTFPVYNKTKWQHKKTKSNLEHRE